MSNDFWACRDFVNRSWLPWRWNDTPTDWLVFQDVHVGENPQSVKRPQLMGRYPSLNAIRTRYEVVSFITNSQVELRNLVVE